MLAVAVIPSNQDNNHPPAGFPAPYDAYSEAGGADEIGRRVVSEFARRGVTVSYWRPLMESADTAGYAGLAAKMREACNWLRLQPLGTTICALHIHTNAARTPQEGASHTGYCYGTVEGARLGRKIALKVGQVLGLPIVAYDYTARQYLFDTLFPGIPSTILEITRHDRLPDLTALYARIDAVSVAIVDGALAWAGENVPPPAPTPPGPDTLRRVLDDLWALSEDTHPAVMRAKTLIGGWG